jgi:hypothetical protein
MAKLEGEELERLENARRAYEHAWGEAKRYGDEALVALQRAEEGLCRGLAFREEARDFFKRKANKALATFENWRKASEVAIEVMQEIASGP